MTRVLFVNTRSSVGADVAVHLTLIKNLDPSRCEVTIATNSRAVDVDRTLEILRGVPGLRVIVLNLGYELTGRSRARKIVGAVGNAFVFVGSLLRLIGLVWRQRIDVIHSTDRPRDALFSTLLARLSGRKNVVHVHIKWFPEIGRATNWALKKCDAVLAISQFVYRSLVEGGIPESKVYTALNATDTSEFDPTKRPSGKLREQLGLAADVPLVGIVARVILWKGHRDLVEAMAKVRDRIPNARLVVIGSEFRMPVDQEDSYAEEVRRRVVELGLTEHVIWAGWIDDMPSVFADLDVVCVPSWEEPFGLVVTEAMAMERPVVGFDAGALPEIFRTEVEGLLVPARNTEMLADAIVRLLSDAALRAEMGKRGRARVIERFTPRRQADDVAAIYEQVCRPSRSAQRLAPSPSEKPVE